MGIIEMIKSKMKLINTIGTKYLQKSYTYDVKQEQSYSKSSIPLGKTPDGKLVYMDTTDALRVLILGANGSGKTFFLRAIADRLHRSGYAPFFLTDVKNEFWTSYRKVQDKFKKDILPNEEPDGMKVVTLRPTFFKEDERTSRLPFRNVWCSPNLKQMTTSEMYTLIRADKKSGKQRTISSRVVPSFIKHLQSNKGDVNFEIINDIVDDIEEITKQMKDSFKFDISPIYESAFYEEEWVRDMTILINDGYVPAINLEGFDNFKNDPMAFVEVMITMLLREVINARRAASDKSVPSHKKIKKSLVILFDEMQRVVNKDDNNCVRKLTEESYDLDRRYGISYIGVIQNMANTPERIINQSRYIFVPATADTNTIGECLLSMNIMVNGRQTFIQNKLNHAAILKNKMRNIKHSWAILDRNTQSCDIIVPLSPLSEHLETTR